MPPRHQSGPGTEVQLTQLSILHQIPDSSVPSQETGWEESFWNELFCVEWDIKP